MTYQFTFSVYQHPFTRPLITHHGKWNIREGIIINLTDTEGKTRQGEIAPLPWFGSQTQQEALKFCQELGNTINDEIIFNLPDSLPACQFAFESATEDITISEESLNYCWLLPTGEEALNSLEGGKGKTFKWKIGVKPITEEINLFKQLIPLLAGAKIRLDANGGLTLAEARQWLELADLSGVVEFLEQPLPPKAFDLMLSLSKDFLTPIALDESVSNLTQLETCYQKGWRGVFVIKPAIAGSPQRLRQFCHKYNIDTVFSSVFETAIGRKAALNLALELNYSNRALGFGIRVQGEYRGLGG